MKKEGILLCLGLFLVGCNNVESSSTNSINELVEINGPTSIGVGEVVVYSINYNGDVFWSSSDPLILNINSNGEAVTYKEGNVTITVKNENNEIIDTIDVVVEIKVSIPTNELELSSLFTTAMSLEK